MLVALFAAKLLASFSAHPRYYHFTGQLQEGWIHQGKPVAIIDRWLSQAVLHPNLRLTNLRVWRLRIMES